eukprot:m.215102 g.215102  ORF g.215102 m.215102 type:complete len:479 (-) comp15588_c2_seq2:385-1821(-)
MAARTGDLANNLRRMQVALRMLQYPGDVSTKDAREGLPEVFLPLIHHALLSYSRHVAGWLAAQGHDLFGKSDLRFIEGAFKVLRDDFKYVPKLTRDQFFAAGFAEQKAILVADVARLCIDKHELLLRQEPKRKSTNGSSARRESNGSAGPANPPAPSAASTTQPRARTSPPAPAPPLLHPPVPAPSASPLASSTPALPDAAPVSGSEEGAATAAGPAAGSTVTQDAWDGEPQQAPSVPPLNPSPPLVAPLHGAQWSQHPPQPFTASSSSSRRVVFAAEPQRFPPSPRGDSELHVRDLGDEALDIATVYAPQYEPDQGPADVWVTSQLRLENRAREQASVQSLAQQPPSVSTHRAPRADTGLFALPPGPPAAPHQQPHRAPAAHTRGAVPSSEGEASLAADLRALRETVATALETMNQRLLLMQQEFREGLHNLSARTILIESKLMMLERGESHSLASLARPRPRIPSANDGLFYGQLI